jgi:hypothetical protein
MFSRQALLSFSVFLTGLDSGDPLVEISLDSLASREKSITSIQAVITRETTSGWLYDPAALSYYNPSVPSPFRALILSDDIEVHGATDATRTILGR